MTEHISVQRKNRVRDSIQRKIFLLEQYSVDGVPQGRFVPTNITQFRLWEDESLGLMKIGSPNTLLRRHNSNLQKRAQELIAHLLNKKHRAKNRRNETNDLRIRLEQKGQLINDLTNQWHTTQHKLLKVQKNERRLKARVSTLERDVSELTRKLATVSPLKAA